MRYDDKIREAIYEEHLDISRPMALAISESDCPAAILYFLRANPKVAEKIRKMRATKIVKEVGRIERAWRTVDAELAELVELNPKPRPADYNNATDYIVAKEVWRYRNESSTRARAGALLRAND